MQMASQADVYCSKAFEKRNLHELAAKFYDGTVRCRSAFICADDLVHGAVGRITNFRLVVDVADPAAADHYFVLANVLAQL